MSTGYTSVSIPAPMHVYTVPRMGGMEIGNTSGQGGVTKLDGMFITVQGLVDYIGLAALNGSALAIVNVCGTPAAGKTAQGTGANDIYAIGFAPSACVTGRNPPAARVGGLQG